MLVLSRRIGERIVIGGDVVVTVLGTRGTQVRLGVEAPDSVGVWREEILADEPAVAVAAATAPEQSPRA